MRPSGAARVYWLLLVAAIAVVGFFFNRDQTGAGVDPMSRTDPAPTSGRSGAAAPMATEPRLPITPAPEPIPGWQILLLPDAGVSADPGSVRVGLAFVSAEDVATHLASGGAAGPIDAAEFAQVRQWRSLPATREADGAVRVGPLTLEGADRYVLQAASGDRLRHYHANFAGDSAPTNLLPVAGSGLRVRRDPGLEGEISLLLRRTGEFADGAQWQSLLSRFPVIDAAFGERPWQLQLGVNELAPLPPQPIEALVLVDGIEAQRTALSLAPGQWAQLDIDPIAHAVARQLSVDLTLRLIARGSETPVESVQVIWQHERGERSESSDTRGRVRFPGVDRQRPQQFELRFPNDGAALPSWPQSRSLSLTLDELYPDQRGARRIEHTVELDRLDWLVASSSSLLLDPERGAGQPYPVYVLQQRVDGGWFDAAAEFFLKVDDGLAVSLTEVGEYRLAVALTPWTVLFSSSVDSSRASRDARHRVRIDAIPGRSVDLIIGANNAPLPRAQVLMPGPLRGLPPFERVADMNGRLRLDGVTVDSVLLEVPGYSQQSVDLRGPVAEVRLVTDKEAAAPER